jgi:hypothetical protein
MQKMDETVPLNPIHESHQSVRRNLFRTIEFQLYTSYTLMISSLLLSFTKIAAGSYILLSQPRDCQVPLFLWNLMNILLEISYLILKAFRFPYVKRARNGEEVEEFYMLQVGFILQSAFYVFWQLPGNLWFWTCGDCFEEATALTGLTLGNLILAYLYMLIPALVLVSLCACLPVAIIFVMMIAGGPQMPASETLLNSICSESYNSCKHTGDLSCTICTVEYAEGDQIIVMQCDSRHFFHTECIKQWLRINSNCPICRSPYVLE